MSWRQKLAEIDPPEGFIPTNKGMLPPEDLVDELTYSSYAYNRDISSRITPESWKRMMNYGFDPILNKDVIERNNAKVDAMERRYQRELAAGRVKYKRPDYMDDDHPTEGSWRKKLLWNQELLDIEYWLNYDESKDEKLDEWFEKPFLPITRATGWWLEEADDKKEIVKFLKNNRARIQKFVSQFLAQHGKINASIIVAYISQEGK
ncbi:MAG: hypothetical protein M0R03_14485 [Novosphingobium sp.]|nr:hypothetical protein [Novosphingobium sp.]